MHLLELAGICKTYRLGNTEIRALDNISLSIGEGEFVAITGPSGSGKSTLMHIMGCVDTPTSGKQFFRGRDVSGLGSGAVSGLRLRQFGFVFQQFYLLGSLTAYENVELPMIEAGVGRRERKRRVQELLEAVGMSARAKHRPGQLSGGEQQRVAIARALSNNPSVIFADEPTGELDSAAGRKVLDLLMDVNRRYGKTLVIVSHDPQVTSVAGRVIRLLDGRLSPDVR
ncbi:MAG TPA: ABC transporter ATP-binding protein [Candidatus Methanoperedenaceae archaeon]|nr:ABC transporter ATP-binding protein [Candidatus Methanoperedenaceae archaeon]